jgi:large subunit ribosomal protein L28
MARSCKICGKGAIPGIKYKRRGMIKRKGGAGSKIVGKTLRRFLPNLQRVKINIKGVVRRSLVCTNCIQSGKITKA